MALAVLGSSFERRGWGHGPHCMVEVQGPSGPGDPVPYNMYTYHVINWIIYISNDKDLYHLLIIGWNLRFQTCLKPNFIILSISIGRLCVFYNTVPFYILALRQDKPISPTILSILSYKLQQWRVKSFFYSQLLHAS